MMQSGRATPGSARVAFRAAAILALAAAALATAALSLVTLNHLKDVVVFSILRGRPVGLRIVAGSLRPEDLLLLLLAAASVAGLIWLEVRRRAYSALLATASDAEAVAVLTILVAWFGHSYLGTGVLLGGDTATHISRFFEVQRGLDAGRLPLWTNYQYAGEPLLWFTGPLTYVVGGGLAFMLQDALLAAKLLLFALHMLSGWTYFAFLRRLGIRTVAAMVAAAGFAGSFAHLHLFLYRGAFPQAFTIVFLVLLFHAADGLLRRQGARWANMAVFALATAGMIVNHQPHAIFAALYLTLFGAVSLLSGFWRWRNLPLLMAGGALGAVAAAIAVIPVLAEADWVMIEPAGALFQLHLPTLTRLLHLVVWRDTRTTWGIDYWAYCGIGLIAFGLVGIVATLLGRLRSAVRGVAMASCLCFAVCLVLYNPVVRDVMFVLFFLGLLAAFGLDWLLDRPVLAHVQASRRLLVATLVVLLDLASTSVQPVARNDKAFLIEAGQRLERTAPNQRVVQIGVGSDGGLDVDKGPDGGPMSYGATVQRIAGNHNMAATRLHNFLISAAQLARDDLQASGVLSPPTQTMLALFNVGKIICNSSIANGCPASVLHTQEDPVLGRLVPVPGTPVLFSRRLVAMSLPRGLEKPMLWPWDYTSAERRPRIDAIDAALRGFVAVENPDLQDDTARAIAVRDAAVPLPTTAETSPGGVWRPSIRGYAVGLDRVTVQVRTDVPGYVQLAHPWFPSTRVTVNGAVTRSLRGAIDLMVLPVPAGSSTIELRDEWTPVRRIAVLVSLLGLFGIALLAVMLAWVDHTATSPQA